MLNFQQECKINKKDGKYAINQFKDGLSGLFAQVT